MLIRVLWILLLLPVVELMLTVFLYNRYGTPFLGFLAVTAIAGALLVGRAKAGVRAAFAPLQNGGVQVASGSLLGLLASARAFFAGIMLIFPGILTDIVALVILLLPGKVISKAAGAQPQAANDDVIEAEFHEVREPRQSLEDRR